jgi:AraC-like DNA-binding protein
MTFEQYRPIGALATTVKTIWIASGGQDEFAEPDPIVPDGCVEIVFNLGDRFRGPDGALQPRDLLAGQMTRPVTAVPTGGVDLIGVRFWSGRAGAAMRHAMGPLQDQLIRASEVMAGAGVLADELGNLAPARRLDHVQRRLPGLLGAVDADRLRPVDAAINVIGFRHGDVDIDAVARAAGVTRRHLERRFRDEVGLTMKGLARITRLHRALALLDDPALPSGAAIAAECGYSDQAHLIRDCRELTGRTPARFTTSRDSLADLIREIPFPV